MSADITSLFLLIAGIGFLISVIQAEDDDDFRGISGIDYPSYMAIPRTNFRCADQEKIPGFYADPEAECQVFHVCYEDRMETFLCPRGTIFNQKILACDYWYSSECNSEHVNYSSNNGYTVEDFGYYPQIKKLGDMPSHYYTAPENVYEKMAALYMDEPSVKSPDQLGQLNYNDKQDDLAAKDNNERNIGGFEANQDTSVALPKDPKLSEFESSDVSPLCQFPSSTSGFSCNPEDASYNMIPTDEDGEEFYDYDNESDFENTASSIEWVEEDNEIDDGIVPKKRYDQNFLPYEHNLLYEHKMPYNDYLPHNAEEPHERELPDTHNQSYDNNLSFEGGGLDPQNSEFLEEDYSSGDAGYADYEDIDTKCSEDDSCYSSQTEDISESSDGETVEFSKRRSNFRDRSSYKRRPLYVVDVSTTENPLLLSRNSESRRRKFKISRAENTDSEKESEDLTRLADSPSELSDITHYELTANERTVKSSVVGINSESDTPVLPSVKQKSRSQRRRLKSVEKSSSDEELEKKTNSGLSLHMQPDSTANADKSPSNLRSEKGKSKRRRIRIVSDRDHITPQESSASETASNAQKSSFVAADFDDPKLSITDAKLRRKVFSVQTEGTSLDGEIISQEKLSPGISHKIRQSVVLNGTEKLDSSSIKDKEKHSTYNTEVDISELSSGIKWPEIKPIQIQPRETMENLDKKSIILEHYLLNETKSKIISEGSTHTSEKGSVISGDKDDNGDKLRALSTPETNFATNLYEGKDSLMNERAKTVSISDKSEKDSHHTKPAAIEESLKDTTLHHESYSETEEDTKSVPNGNINSNLTKNQMDGENISDASKSHLSTNEFRSESVTALKESGISGMELPEGINSTDEYTVSDEDLDFLVSQLNSDLLAIAEGGMPIKSAFDTIHDVREHIPIHTATYTKTKDVNEDSSVEYAVSAENPFRVFPTKAVFQYEDDYSRFESTKGDNLPDFTSIYFSPQDGLSNAEVSQSSPEEHIEANLKVEFSSPYIEGQVFENKDAELPAHPSISSKNTDRSEWAGLENFQFGSSIPLQDSTGSITDKSKGNSFSHFSQPFKASKFYVPAAGSSLQENLDSMIFASNKNSPYLDYTRTAIPESLTDDAIEKSSNIYGKEMASEPLQTDESSSAFQYSDPEESLAADREGMDLAFGNITPDFPVEEMTEVLFPEGDAYNFQYPPTDEIDDVETRQFDTGNRNLGSVSEEMLPEQLYGLEFSPNSRYLYSQTSDGDREVADDAFANLDFGLPQREIVPQFEFSAAFNQHLYPTSYKTYDSTGVTKEAALNSGMDSHLAQGQSWYTEEPPLNFQHPISSEIAGLAYERNILQAESERRYPLTKSKLDGPEKASIATEDTGMMDNMDFEQEGSLFYLGDSTEDLVGDSVSSENANNIFIDKDSSESVGGGSTSFTEHNSGQYSYISEEKKSSTSQNYPEIWLSTPSETSPEEMDEIVSNKDEIIQSAPDFDQDSSEKDSQILPDDISESEDDTKGSDWTDNKKELSATFTQTEYKILPTVIEGDFDSAKNFENFDIVPSPSKPDTEQKTKSGRALDESESNVNKLSSISTALTFLAKLKPPVTQANKAKLLLEGQTKVKQDSFIKNEARLFNTFMHSNSQDFGGLGNKPATQPKLHKGTSSFQNFVHSSKTFGNLNLEQTNSFPSASKISKLKSLPRRIISMKKSKFDSVKQYI